MPESQPNSHTRCYPLGELQRFQIMSAPNTIAKAPVTPNTTHCMSPPVRLPAFLLLGLGAALEVVAAFSGPSTPPSTFAGVTEFATFFAAA
jgi:hypothetical protein